MHKALAVAVRYCRHNLPEKDARFLLLCGQEQRDDLNKNRHVRLFFTLSLSRATI